MQNKLICGFSKTAIKSRLHEIIGNAWTYVRFITTDDNSIIQHVRFVLMQSMIRLDRAQN